MTRNELTNRINVEYDVYLDRMVMLIKKYSVTRKSHLLIIPSARKEVESALKVFLDAQHVLDDIYFNELETRMYEEPLQ